MDVHDEAIVRIFENIQSGQTQIVERLATVEAIVKPLPDKLETCASEIQELAKGYARINGPPFENQARLNGLWKWLGMIGGVGILAGGVGSLLFQVAIKWMDG